MPSRSARRVPFRRGRRVLGLVVAVMVAAACADATVADRRATVASRGAEVMPFDLDKTTHTFTKTDRGGIQLVTADDPGDDAQILLVREHLRAEQVNFSVGDYDDPAQIHGMDMPGVSELRAGHDRVTVSYADRPGGAELTYETGDADLVVAIHSWFDRQVMDHGSHAIAR